MTLPNERPPTSLTSEDLRSTECLALALEACASRESWLLIPVVHYLARKLDSAGSPLGRPLAALLGSYTSALDESSASAARKAIGSFVRSWPEETLALIREVSSEARWERPPPQEATASIETPPSGAELTVARSEGIPNQFEVAIEGDVFEAPTVRRTIPASSPETWVPSSCDPEVVDAAFRVVAELLIDESQSPIRREQFRTHVHALASGEIEVPESERTLAIEYVAAGVAHAQAYLKALQKKAARPDQLLEKLIGWVPSIQELPDVNAKDDRTTEPENQVRATKAWGSLAWMTTHLQTLQTDHSPLFGELGAVNPCAFGNDVLREFGSWANAACQLDSVTGRLRLRELDGLIEAMDPNELGLRLSLSFQGSLDGKASLSRLTRRLLETSILVVEAARALGSLAPEERREKAKLIEDLRGLVRTTRLDRLGGRGYLRRLGFPLPGDPGVLAIEVRSLRGRLAAAPRPEAQRLLDE